MADVLYVPYVLQALHVRGGRTDYGIAAWSYTSTGGVCLSCVSAPGSSAVMSVYSGVSPSLQSGECSLSLQRARAHRRTLSCRSLSKPLPYTATPCDEATPRREPESGLRALPQG